MCRFNNFKWNNDLLEDQSSFLAINSQVGTVLQMVIVFGLGEENRKICAVANASVVAKKKLALADPV